jgi:hypothetical protein
MLQTCIWKVLASNLVLDTGCLDRGFCIVFLIPTEKFGNCTSNKSWPLVSNYFQFIIHTIMCLTGRPEDVCGPGFNNSGTFCTCSYFGISNLCNWKSSWDKGVVLQRELPEHRSVLYAEFIKTETRCVVYCLCFIVITIKGRIVW